MVELLTHALVAMVGWLNAPVAVDVDTLWPFRFFGLPVSSHL